MVWNSHQRSFLHRNIVSSVHSRGDERRGGRLRKDNSCRTIVSSVQWVINKEGSGLCCSNGFVRRSVVFRSRSPQPRQGFGCGSGHELAQAEPVENSCPHPAGSPAPGVVAGPHVDRSDANSCSRSTASSVAQRSRSFVINSISRGSRSLS